MSYTTPTGWPSDLLSHSKCKAWWESTGPGTSTFNPEIWREKLEKNTHYSHTDYSGGYRYGCIKLVNDYASWVVIKI